MAHNHIATDSPLSRRIVRAFLYFLNSGIVEPGPGVDAEGIEVARECLAEAFKLNSSPVAGDDVKSDSLIDIFKSLEANKQCETSKSDVGPLPDSADASSSFLGENPARGKNHSEASKSTYLKMNCADNSLLLWRKITIFGAILMGVMILGNWRKLVVYSMRLVWAAAYTQINKYTEAIQDCLRSIEIDPNYTKAYSRLGLVYYAQGNYRDAIHKGFRKALQLDPNNESVKENIRVAERKLLEEQHRAYPNQLNIFFLFHSLKNTRSSQEFPNQSAQGGSRSHGEPPPFSSMPFNPRDIASMFMNFTNATNAQQQGSHSQERQEDSNGSGASEPEIRIGGNISVNMEDMPEDITGAFQSMMEMLSGAAPPGQPQDQMNGRAAPN
ncbi:small glutamine-rich tetratricopeptide repeat-containing protein alpha-like isoform X5 [Glycine soja]|uniref:small glutamine-rich tetratricopeptide repeat-containing protein alpha isoform X5 n=1 Tax=Glycine max TaxID=3847 RepID=UPI00071929C7|nr:small glutamine-rich tetratricopeptide repeat-containing protein alpha isoform X5 [Glycine max]XP_028201378.1 small glutamine-rich tetratricopeptide repeat-containing protein alpha-like isoform X5 [Glycine soja]|eukprot:XP_014622405.1 small glutamine-rich tetratricopeptide repeat-containing protein alpha isoform X6 [Glycine max]